MFAHADLMQLIDVRDRPCLSLYMPTHRAGRGRRQDEIRHKNLLRDAEEMLAEREISRQEIDGILQPAAEVPHDTDLWAHRDDGLAIFSAPGVFRCFSLPAKFPELVLVDDHFHVSPLVRLLHENRRFFILALTKDSADLYEATRNTLAECELLELAPVVVDGTETALQFHSQRAPTQGKGETAEAMFHGHGGPNDRADADLENFVKRQVEPEVTAALRDQEAPLVLACVDELVPIYREANSYQHLVVGHVSGSPTEYSHEVLRESAWRLVAPLFAEMEQAAREKFGDLSSSERTLDEPQPIIEAARNGRVETLFVPRDLPAARGMPESNGERSAEAYYAIEEAVEFTLRNGGQVLAVADVPGESAVAAVLRY